MPTTLWTMDFNAGSDAEKVAKAARYYQTPALLAGEPARLTNVTVGGVTALRCSLGVPPGGTVSFKTHAELVTANIAEGAYANCYDADPTKHGLIRKTAGVLVRQGPVLDQPWFDQNHVGIGGYGLGLLIQSWATNSGDTGTLDDWGPDEFNGWPYIADLRGLELHARVRAMQLKMPREGKIAQHFQAPAQTHGDPGGGRRTYVNALQAADLYSDALKFGRGGLYAPNVTDGVYDSGWVDLVIRLSDLDSFWNQLGARTQRDGLPGGFDNLYVYGVEEPNVFLNKSGGNPFNAYIVYAQPVTDEASAEAFPSATAFSGDLLVQWFKLVDPA